MAIPTEPVGSLPRPMRLQEAIAAYDQGAIPHEQLLAEQDAAEFIPEERLGSTDDCGFSPFSVDRKPKHGSPDVARDIAFAKIASRVEGTRIASEKLGV